MAEIKTGAHGQVQIADEVLAVIAGTAMREVEGVAGLTGHYDLGEILGRKNMAKGITIAVENEKVFVTADVVVKLEARVQETALAVQKRIKTAIETMTGLAVAEVNVNVTGVTFDRQKANA